MLEKNAHINVAYHFMAEAIIIFLFAIPFLKGEYQQVPYWSYLALSLGLCIIYTLYSVYHKVFAWYIITAPIYMLVFFFVGYPFLLSVAFPILFTYRYIFLRKDSMLKRETIYINITIPLAIFLLIWIKDPEIVLYAFLLLILLLSGNIYSHLYHLKKMERHIIGKKLWLTFSGFTGILALFMFLLFYFRDVFNKMWYGLMEIPGYLGGIIGTLIGQLFPDPKPPDSMENNDPLDDLLGSESQTEKLTDLLPEDRGTPFFEKYGHLIYWVVGAIILIIILFIAVRYFRNRFKPAADTTQSDVTSYDTIDIDKNGETHTSFFSRLFKSPHNKVRKLIYQFERDAEKVNAGRYSYETLDTWMNRLGFDVDLTAYKRVRYGNNEEINDDEAQALKKQLQTIRHDLKNNK
ncbi:MAG TPA: hypothetical protein VK142_11060 [Bacillota bacterium]|nr:hypothetical protein [Bacillota bacterium]